MKGEFDMTPNGTDLLATLIKLLADQEGVTITYTLEQKKEKEKR
jgi:hypothetical protein